MIRPIVLWPDPILSQICAPIEQIDAPVQQLATDMLETMYDAPGRGLAAPQVGVLLRMFVMDTAWKDGDRTPTVVINPNITDRSDQSVIGPEGCLSIPGVTADVTRAAEITMQWTGLDGSLFVERLTGFTAICAQHEFDHLEGRVTFDRLTSDVRSILQAEYLA